MSLQGVQRRTSRWGHRTSYWVGKREFAHLHDENELDIRITRRSLKRVKEIGIDPRVKLRPGPSDWIGFELRNRKDIDGAFKLLTLAWRNNKMVWR